MANKVLKLNQFMKVLKKAPPKVIEKPINQEKDTDTSDIIRQLKDFMSNKSNVVDAPVEKTELNDEESNDVMDYIFYYKRKYFPTINLSGEIVKNFIYNIPHDVYLQHKDAVDYGDEIMDPLILFIAFCTNDCESIYGKFLSCMMEACTESENQSKILEEEEAYDNYIAESEDDENTCIE